MKKVLLLALFVLLTPLALQAEGAVGIATYYRQPVWFDEGLDFSGAGFEDFMFGLNALWQFSFLQVEGLALVTPTSDVLLDGYLLGGLVLDLMVVRLSAVAGPHLAFNSGTDDLDTFVSAKAGLDLVLGNVAIGVSYLTDLNFDDGLDREPGSGFLGLNLMFGW